MGFAVFGFVGVFPREGMTTALTCETIPELMRAYLVSHVVKRDFSSEMKERTVDQYIQLMDPAKAILFEEDVKWMRAVLSSLFSKMRENDCSSLRKVQDVLLKRSKEVEAFVKGFVGKSYQFNGDVSFIIDPEKRKFAKNSQEREEFLKSYIHFQISNYLLTDVKLEDAKTKLLHRYELVSKRVKDRSDSELNILLTKAFAAALDPHSEYLSNEDLEDFKIGMGLSLEGIGATLSSQDGFTVVEEIVPGGAADRGKALKNKDKITGVAQGEKGEFVTVIDMELRDVVKLIRGKKATKVRLNVLRNVGKETKRVEITIVRDKVDLTQQQAQLRFENRKIEGRTFKLAILDLPSFYGDGRRSSYKDMRLLVKKASDQKADGLLLNLSRNGGGLLDDAIRISGLFINQGGIVGTQDAHKNVDISSDTEAGLSFNGPMVILMSRYSASASEILAGALQDYKRALVVGGDHTFGKGTVQAVMPLPKNLGAMKVTTHMFFLPGGKSTQHLGVPGDIVMPSVYHNDEVGEKSLEYSLESQTIKNFLSTKANSTDPKQAWKVLDSALIKSLAKRSADRIKADKSFDEVRKEIEEYSKKSDMIKLSEVRARAIKNKDKYDKDEKKSLLERAQEAEAPYVNEALNILVDLVGKQTNAVSF